jgi:hypothetical protein
LLNGFFELNRKGKPRIPISNRKSGRNWVSFNETAEILKNIEQKEVKRLQTG